MRDFRKLKVWGEGHRLTLRVYEATSGFPREELYGLVTQLRRCSASIPANIAEGCGRCGDAELNRFMLISMGSASELEYHLLLWPTTSATWTPDNTETSQITRNESNACFRPS